MVAPFFLYFSTNSEGTDIILPSGAFIFTPVREVGGGGMGFLRLVPPPPNSSLEGYNVPEVATT
jgi:hypothetical protein